jgi:hypothetical protein
MVPRKGMEIRSYYQIVILNLEEPISLEIPMIQAMPVNSALIETLTQIINLAIEYLSIVIKYITSIESKSRSK